MRSADNYILGLQPRKSSANSTKILRIPTWMLRTHAIVPVWSTREHGHHVAKKSSCVPLALRDSSAHSSEPTGYAPPSGAISTNFAMPAFQGATSSNTNSTSETGSSPAVQRNHGGISVDQCRLIFAVFEVATRQGDDLVFSPADVFRFHCGKESSGSALRQLEKALATFCDLGVVYRNLPNIGDGQDSLVAKLDTGRLCMSSRSIRKGEPAIDKLERAFEKAPSRRRLWRIRLSDAGQALLFETHYIGVDTDVLGSLPRSPIARWLYLWVQSHGAIDGRILPYRISTIAAHAGYSLPGYDERYSQTDDGQTNAATRTTRWFHRVQERIQRYIPQTFGRVSGLCGWGVSQSRNADPVIHVLRAPNSLRDSWCRIADRFSPTTAFALLLRKATRLRKGAERTADRRDIEAPEALERWLHQAEGLARAITGDRTAPPDILLDDQAFSIAGTN